MIFCGNCGVELETNIQFCPNCGTKTNAAGSAVKLHGTVKEGADIYSTIPPPVSSRIEGTGAVEQHVAHPPPTGPRGMGSASSPPISPNIHETGAVKQHVAYPPPTGPHGLGSASLPPTSPHIEGTGTVEPHVAYPPPIGPHGMGPYHPLPPGGYPHYPRARRQPNIFSSFLSSPLKTIQEGYVNPAIAVIILLLVPLSSFLSFYAGTWRYFTDTAQMLVDNRLTVYSVTVIRIMFMDQINWTAAFGNTVAHYLIVFFIYLLVIYLVMKIRGHAGAIDAVQFFSLSALISIIFVVYMLIASLVMFISFSWGGFMFGELPPIGTDEAYAFAMGTAPYQSMVLAAVSSILHFVAVKRIFKCSTENAVIAIVIAALVSYTYQMFATERVLYAAIGDLL